jgi:uncharacterized protein
MSGGGRFRRTAKAKAKKPGALTLEQLEEWLDTLDPPAAGVSMIDGYLAALVVSPRFLPPEEWLGPIVGARVAQAPDGGIEGAVRNTLFNRYNEISKTLSGGPKRYAPIYMRTDDGEVLIKDFANGFHLGMQLSIDDWKPFISNPQIGMAMIAILGHCTNMFSQDEREAVMNPEAAELLARSWKVVPEVVEMLHLELAKSRNIEIR